MDNILRLEDVSYHYQDGMKQVNILNECDYTFEKGKCYAIVGPSGSGKTTLLTLLGGLDQPMKGSIYYDDQDIVKMGLTNYRRDKISIVFQSYNLIHYMNAYQNVISAMEIAKIKVKNKKEKAIELLKTLGLSEEESKRDIKKLSGGQQQRVAIARALAKETDFILCDEPTGNLDEQNANDIIDSFIDIAHTQDKCIIVVTHSNELANKFDKKLKIIEGHLIEI